MKIIGLKIKKNKFKINSYLINPLKTIFSILTQEYET